MTMNDFELERQQRIETNRKRMLEMGIQAMASKIQAPAPVPAPPVRARPFQTTLFFFPPDYIRNVARRRWTTTRAASRRRAPRFDPDYIARHRSSSFNPVFCTLSTSPARALRR
jgi:hypothetical protein